MKKIILILMACTSILSSCKNEQTEVLINMSQSTTVKGKIEMSSTSVNGTPVYAPANGLKVYITVKYSDLANTTNTGSKRFETTTNSTGEYSINVPSTTTGITAQIYTERKDGESYSANKLQKGYFEFTAADIDLKAGQFTVKDIVMTFTARPELNR